MAMKGEELVEDKVVEKGYQSIYNLPNKHVYTQPR